MSVKRHVLQSRSYRVVAALTAAISTTAYGQTFPTPAQNQAQINAIPWTNGKGDVTGNTLKGLFTSINQTFNLYAPLAGNNTWTGVNTFTNPIVAPGLLLTFPNVQHGDPIPATGNFYVNSSGFVAISQ